MMLLITNLFYFILTLNILSLLGAVVSWPPMTTTLFNFTFPVKGTLINSSSSASLRKREEGEEEGEEEEGEEEKGKRRRQGGGRR